MRKTILLFALLALSISSCADTSKEEQETKSAGEIIDQYVDTLVTAPDKTKDAATEVDERHDAQMKAIEELDQ
jgi:ABC-type Fe3+-hydroxamate transport system substrate-binding protein